MNLKSKFIWFLLKKVYSVFIMFISNTKSNARVIRNLKKTLKFFLFITQEIYSVKDHRRVLA